MQQRLTAFQDRKYTEQASSDPEEQKRMEYYLGLLKPLTADLAAKKGSPPTCHVVNFGCQMNARDAEKLLGVLLAAGFAETQDENADFLIFNTCTVRDNADQRLFGRLGRISHFKRQNPAMKVAVCGCMMQEEGNVERIRKSYPFVDLVFGTHNLFRFPEYLFDVYTTGEKLIDIWSRTDRIMEEMPVSRKYPFKSGVNITFGCNNFCTYCIVPYVRGRERSRSTEEILDEIKRLVGDGVKEVMLLGQNVNSYGRDLKDGSDFAKLLEKAAEIDGLKRIRYMTPHPKDFTKELIEVIRENPNIARHVHLPLQSGSTAVLKKMNRGYSKEQFLELAGRIRERLPDASVTTDLIVGFPGETESDIEDTLDVIRSVEFDNAFTFIYSRRRGTPAASMPDNTPEEVIKERFDRVLSAVQESAKKRSLLLSGQLLDGLIEEENEQDPALMTARLSNNMIVHVPGDSSMIGTFAPIRLKECKGFYYFGEIEEKH